MSIQFLKIANLRCLSSSLAIAPIRNFALSASVMAPRAKTVDPKAIKEEKKKLKEVQKKLAKEKSTLKLLESRHRAILKKQKSLQKQRSAAEEVKALKQALKPYRLITGLNVFIRENVTPQRSMAEVAPQWNNLSEGEKAAYKRKADQINEQQLKLYPPKPKRPANAYASFVKENWFDGESNSVVMKELSVQWKKLPESEKESYKPSASIFNKYSEDLKAWKDHRLRAYKQHGSPSSTTA